jgi:hypothetical protein
MRRLALGLALASTALATPALARDKSWYVEGDLGATIVESNKVVNISSGQPAGGSTVGYFNTKTGYDFGGIIGYDFGPFRLETEASYRRAQAKSSPRPRARCMTQATTKLLAAPACSASWSTACLTSVPMMVCRALSAAVSVWPA